MSNVQSRKFGFFDSIAFIYVMISVGVAITFGIGSIVAASNLLGMPGWAWAIWIGCFLPTAGIGFLSQRNRFICVGSCIVPLAIYVLIGSSFDAKQIELQVAPFTMSIREMFAPFGWLATVVSPIAGLFAAVIIWREGKMNTLPILESE